jgi:signal transduction histidine kinase
MPANPWAAIDTTTSPSSRARELWRIWHDYLSDGRLDRVRAPIAESWHRSEVAGVSPSRSLAPTMVADRSEVSERWDAHPLMAAAPLIRRWLGPIAGDSDHLIVVSNAEGLLLWLEGDARVRSAAADAMNFTEGALWSEAGAGTNAIGTALAADHPLQVHAAEHFSEIVHAWTCSAAPVHDPEDGRLLGVIDLTGLMSRAHPDTLAAALGAARAVESELRFRAQGRDARLRADYLGRIEAARGRIALVSRSGRLIADHPDGFTSSQRLAVPRGGGMMTLPGGRDGYAEALDGGDAYLVHDLSAHGGSRPEPEGASMGATTGKRAGVPEIAGWRRSQFELMRLAEEQAALRHVATLVASQAMPEEIFATVAEEVARLLKTERGVVCRYEGDGTATVAAYWTSEERTLPVGTVIELDGDSVVVRVQQSGQPSRLDNYDGVRGHVYAVAASLGGPPRSTVGAPILVEGRVWGAIIASTTGADTFGADAESRLMSFAELVATAISNAVARAELNASRARIVAAADDARRRIERDLHDGAQQRLVSLALDLRTAASNGEAGTDDLRDELSRASAAVMAALDELREISHGIHPAILTKGGLDSALRALVRRCAIPVELEISDVGPLGERIEVTAYYVVSETLANAVKHAHASLVRVTIEQDDKELRLVISDDGVGGANASAGSGLTGLYDRVEALGGAIHVESPARAGTTVQVSLPLTTRS